MFFHLLMKFLKVFWFRKKNEDKIDG